MKFFNWLKPKNNNTVDLSRFFFNSGGSNEFNDPLGDVTYFTCLKILSEAISKLSIHLIDKDNNRIYDHNIIKLLNERPNDFMTPSTFKQVVEFSRNHNGNSYIYINYKAGEIVGLYPIKSNLVEIIINDSDKLLPKIIYRYQNEYFLPNEIIHLKGGYSEDGIKGKSIVSILKNVFSLSNKSDVLVKKMYDNGLMGKTIIKISDALNESKRKELIQKLQTLLQNGNNAFLPLPMNTEVQNLNLNLNNSQFSELKKYTSNQIAAAFGISPVYLNDYSKSSFSSSEAQNLSFYTDTMLSILRQYEEELNYKLLTKKERDAGLTLKFNLAGVLRGDLKTQAEAIQTLVGNGIYKINEARDLLSMPKIEEGDTTIVNGSYVKLSDIGIAYKGGDKDV